MVGEYITADEKTPFDEILPYILGSSSIPLAFPYVEFKGRLMSDGGVINSLDPISAIKKCKEIVDDEQNIIVDIILNNPSIHAKVKNSIFI